MGWTNPRTWIVAEKGTAALMNQQLRDNLNFLRSAHACRVWHSGNTNCPDSTQQVLAFDSESFDTDNFHDPAANNSRLLIPAGLDGYYILMGTVVFAANGTGLRDARLLLNGATVMNTGRQQNVGAAKPSRAQANTTFRLVAGDYVELAGYQESGGALNALGGDIDQTQLSLIYLGL